MNPPPVEAQSISSLSNLLANPPRYPRNPTHQVHDPLVLYIVRVPGSKDVFLTTLKPPTKASISIDAVQSSLYFLHVERPEDDALRESLEAATVVETPKSDATPIQRKPLPPTPFANYPPSQKPPTPPKSYPHYQPPIPGAETANQAERYVARGVNLRLNVGDPSKSSGSRKPMGARLMPGGLNPGASDQSSNSDASPSPIENAQRQFRLGRKPVESMFPYHAPGTNMAGVDHESSPDGITTQRLPPILDENPVPSQSYETPRITLIRRDPASGSQWNVGTILPQNAAGPLHQVDIALTSPGYTPFAKLDTGDGGGFRRKVAFLPTSALEGVSMTSRSNSAETFLNSPHSSHGRSRQAYAFISPWQGMCAFSNGLDGKSLRCRQSLPGANPSMPAVVADVAELRFNLPWAALRIKDPNKKQGSELSNVSPNRQMTRMDGSSNREQWRRSFQVLKHKARKQLSIGETNGANGDWQFHGQGSSQLWQSGEEHRLSLDLGREKAGGGFKGHSAKLGKLIIHDEGLKMCDLVVAACMGVWWQHYAGDVN